MPYYYDMVSEQSPEYRQEDGTIIPKVETIETNEALTLAGGKKNPSYGFAIAKKAVPVGVATATALPYAIATAEYTFIRGEDPLHK
ncbi:hypothetical protein AGMMS49579_26150 [Spirochaetia bacterium]|nr:hypothetical protein AGMMS49579_26150 [Spirochaetia bacterium]